MGLLNKVAAWLINKGYNESFVKKQLDSLPDGEVYARELFRGLYPGLSKGTLLARDTQMEYYITNGYSSNPDTLGIVDKISNKFADIPIIPFKGEKELEKDPLDIIFSRTNSDYTKKEFMKEWELFGLITGNSIVNFDLLNIGNNSDLPKFLKMMPTQDTEIESGGWKQPVGKYKLRFNSMVEIDPENVWHTRLFLELVYRNGSNFMGMSPVRVAANVILSQNYGYDLSKDTLKSPIPPAIISRKDAAPVSSINKEKQSEMEKRWDAKVSARKSKPFFGEGDYQVNKLGYENLKDLDIVNGSEHGLRVLCNVWGVPSQMFNDSESTTYNNMKSAERVMYTDRILPDMEKFVWGLNNIIFKKSGIHYEVDTSKLEALREDRLKTAQSMALHKDIVHPNEIRAALGLPELTDDEIEELRFSAFMSDDNSADNLLNSDEKKT